MTEMKEVRDWCDVVPSPAPIRLTKALGQLDAAMAREADKHRPVAAGHRMVLFSRRRWRGWAAPLATAVAVTAVIAGALTASHLVFGVRGKSATALPRPSYASLPLYYEGDHGIRATATGRLIMAVPHAPLVATAIPNGLTFVLGSQEAVRPASGAAGLRRALVEPITFELVHVTPGGTTHVSHLSLPEALTMSQRPNIALSPDGRRLAVAYRPYRGRFTAVVQVITLATGQVRQWTWHDAKWSPVINGVNAWSADGRTLAVTQRVYSTRLLTAPQILLLNTAAPGGGRPGGGRPSRQVVLHVPAGYRIDPSPVPVLTPNGAELIAPVETGKLPNPWRGGIATFSARTGALVGVRGRWVASAHEVRAWNTLQILAWSSWSGSKLIEVQPKGSTQVLGELSGGVFTRTGPLLPRQAAGYQKLRRALIADSGVIW